MDRSFSHRSDHFSRITYVSLCFFAVFAGGLIYILFRPAEPVFLGWFHAVGIENWMHAVREKSLSIYPFLPRWVVYSLPDGLWAFAYTLIILGIWNRSNSFLKYFWFLSIPLLVFGFEMLQLTGELPGTFCLNDILWSAAGIMTGCIMVYIKTRDPVFSGSMKCAESGTFHRIVNFKM